MSSDEEPLTRARLASLRGRLLEWLIEAAYPLWASRGVDRRRGGFVEMLGQDATPVPSARRIRVQPRQIFSFARAATFGWRGDIAAIVRGGIACLEADYLREDGLFRTLVGADGEVADNRALLYDQAFVLLGFAAAGEALDQLALFERRALQLRGLIEKHWRADAGGFSSGESGNDLRETNPHMHLLEACLEWAQIGNDRGWRAWVDEITGLTLKRLQDPPSGLIPETFTSTWERLPGIGGRVVEPGHQFEWAWLLLRCRGGDEEIRDRAALRLIHAGERAGTLNGVVINAILDDFTPHDPAARLWPQTERLKAAVLAAEITGDPAYASIAVEAASSLMSYLDTPVEGLWFDSRRPDGQMVDGPAPASTFYHLVTAISTLALTRGGAACTGARVV
ncbi:MAG TPA: AGE family epimerase/isomerase [Steroidobacteraceae bacterium]|nr:AGE family epimerase/isomerase [Steroidobacteraceae bacterium]